MTVSQNGWLASPEPSAIGIVPLDVAGVGIIGGVRGGDVATVLGYVLGQVAERVEAPISGQCGGYVYRANVNDPSSLSNHSSGTAVDFNWEQHPNAVPTTSTWSADQINEIHTILAEVAGAVRWGGDYHHTPDAMHFEIIVSPERLAAVAANIGGSMPPGTISTAGAVKGADNWADAPLLEYGTRSAPTPSTNLTVDPDEAIANAEYSSKTAWWKVQIPDDHNPGTPVRFDTVESTLVDPDGADTYMDTILAVYRDVPADEIQANQLLFHNGPRYNADLDMLDDRADGDVLLDPGTTVYVQVSLNGGAADLNMILRVGDLAPDTWTSDWITPPPQSAVFTRYEDERITEFHVTFGPQQADDSGVTWNPAEPMPRGIGAHESGSYETVICPPIFDEAQARYPLQGATAQNLIGNTISGTGVSGGKDHDYDDLVPSPTQGLVYPEGHYEYSRGAGVVGAQYTYSMHPFSYGYGGNGDSIRASTSTTVGAHSVDNAFGTILHTGDQELLDAYSYGHYGPTESGYMPPRPNATWELQEGTAELLPEVKAIVYWRMASGIGPGEGPAYAEPRDRVIFAHLPGATDFETGEPAPMSVADMVTEMRVFATEPMLVDDRWIEPQGSPFRYEYVSLPDNWRPNPDDYIVITPSISVAGPIEIKTMPGVTLEHGLPLDFLWMWRFAGGSNLREAESMWALGAEANDRQEWTGVDARIGFEYRYQPPTFRWQTELPRMTVEAAAEPTGTHEGYPVDETTSLNLNITGVLGDGGARFL